MLRLLLSLCVLSIFSISVSSNSYDGSFDDSDSSGYAALEEFSKLNDEEALIAFYLNEMEMEERTKRDVDLYEDDNSDMNEYDEYESADANDYGSIVEIDQKDNTNMFNALDYNEDSEYDIDRNEEEREYYDDYDADYDEEDNDYLIYDREARSQNDISSALERDKDGETSEETEHFYRKRRSAEKNTGICGTLDEEHLLKRISSMQEALAVLEKDLDLKQNSCAANPKTESTPILPTTTSAPSTTAPTRAEAIQSKHRHHHTNVEDLLVCEI